MTEKIQKQLSECKDLILYDLETTGINPLYHRIIEIGALWLTQKDGRFVEKDRLHRYFRIPEDMELPEVITELTGLTKERLRKEAYEEECLEELLFFFENLPVAGYNNRRFDDLFLQQCFYRYGITFCPVESFDVLLMARDFIPSENVENFKLETIADYFGIKATQYHSAVSDAEVTAKLLNCMIDCCRNGGNAAFHGTKRPEIVRVAYWGKEGQENETDTPVKRIYVSFREEPARVFFDVINSVWYTDSMDIDMEWLEERCMEMTNTRTEEEFRQFRGKTIRK